MHAQVDAQLTRDHLARLLAEENSALDEFESLLDREHVDLAHARERVAIDEGATTFRQRRVKSRQAARVREPAATADLRRMRLAAVGIEPAVVE